MHSVKFQCERLNLDYVLLLRVEEEEEEAEKCGLLSGQGVNSCRRHGTGQGGKPTLPTPCVG